MPAIKGEHSLEVQAGAERLWGILTDVQSWPKWQWASYARLITKGPLKEGSKLVAEFGGLKWNLTVTKAERPNRLYWTGRRMGLKGVHEWEFLEEGGRTKAVSRESMSGWMLFPLYLSHKKRLPRTAGKWLVDLKSRAEQP